MYSWEYRDGRLLISFPTDNNILSIRSENKRYPWIDIETFMIIFCFPKHNPITGPYADVQSPDILFSLRCTFKFDLVIAVGKLNTCIQAVDRLKKIVSFQIKA